MTTDELALLAAVLADPGDATPRLVYADWLDEHAGFEECTRCKDRGAVGWDYVNGMGNPPKVYTCPECTAPGYVPKPDGRAARAEFIRVQCELETGLNPKMKYLSHTPECQCRWCYLRRREGELFNAHWKYWFDNLGVPGEWLGRADGAPLLTGRFGDALVRRGFVESVTCSWEAWAGGECENCGGFGEFRRRHDNGDGPEGPCPDCGGKWNSGPHDDPDDYWDRGTGRTPGLAESLIWRAEVACPACGGVGDRYWEKGSPYRDVDSRCPACEDGTGRVPNPDPTPPTAQPARRIVFAGDRLRWIIRADYAEIYTTHENIAYRCRCKPPPGALAMESDEYLKLLLAAEFGDIEFTLPGEYNEATAGRASNTDTAV
jgi:uncharacterized protein (TIGR02996 family)